MLTKENQLSKILLNFYESKKEKEKNAKINCNKV